MDMRFLPEAAHMHVLKGWCAMTSATEKKPPMEAKGDCTICKGWVDDGRGGTCVFTDDY